MAGEPGGFSPGRNLYGNGCTILNGRWKIAARLRSLDRDQLALVTCALGATATSGRHPLSRSLASRVADLAAHVLANEPTDELEAEVSRIITVIEVASESA